MALKRSGVRASFAPSIYHGFPRIRRSASLSACSLLSRFQILLFLACLLMAAPIGAQQAPSNADPKTRTDVFLFVRPDSPTSARIGLSYRKRLPHSQVQREIEALLAASGWKLKSQPEITDRSVRPDNPTRFPPTTGAEFAVLDAPQFHDNAPVMEPYLKAFQAWDHLEILFVTSDLVPYNGVTNFRSPALDVTLAKSEGIYDYLITIRDHSKPLPRLVPDVPGGVANNGGKTSPSSTTAQNPHGSTGATTSNNASLFWPYLLIIVGSVLAGGVALFLLAKRHQDNLKPGRSR